MCDDSMDITCILKGPQWRVEDSISPCHGRFGEGEAIADTMARVIRMSLVDHPARVMATIVDKFVSSASSVERVDAEVNDAAAEFIAAALKLGRAWKAFESKPKVLP